jgi:hypothetical protein
MTQDGEVKDKTGGLMLLDVLGGVGKHTLYGWKVGRRAKW